MQGRTQARAGATHRLSALQHRASLVIDTANQCVPGLAPRESVSSWLHRSAAGVHRILALARHVQLRPIFVAESPHKSAAQLEKFRSRHEKKLRRGQQTIPFNGTLLVCEQALRAGASVLCDAVHEADLVAEGSSWGDIPSWRSLRGRG